MPFAARRGKLCIVLPAPLPYSLGMEKLVSTQWLADHLSDPDLVVLDASAHLPDAGRDPATEFAQGHIPGARFLDLASFFDPESPVPSALPNAKQFAQRMAALGVPDGARVVVYDDSYVKTAARAWFILRMHGVRGAAILDGGLGKWRNEGRPLENGTPAITPTTYNAGKGSAPVRFKADMLANLESRAEQVVGRGRPVAAGCDHLRRRGDGSGAAVRAGPGGQAGCGPLRWQLERMGRRSRYPEGTGPPDGCSALSKGTNP
jgi:3-mercaptopyruvate sulfurtransferase SseA